MVIDILSYEISPLNEVLKTVIVCLFLGAAFLFYSSWRKYGGILKSISGFLLIGAIFGFFSAFYRLGGDFYSPFKWGESLFNLAFAILMLILALMIRKKLQSALEILGIGENE